MIIRDGAYPLSNWLLKPFPDNGALTREQTKFNRTLSSARSIVERGQLFYDHSSLKLAGDVF